MAEDKLKKPNARNQQPPSSQDGGPEAAYGNPTVSTSNDVAFQKSERPAARGGVHSTQKEVGAREYPGRAVPPTQAVTQAVCKEGETKKCVNVQTDSNRYELNEHVRKHGGKA